MQKARDSILKRQQSWASKHGITFNKKGYVTDLADNLYKKLMQDSQEEFIRSRGDELANKMLALHSSSALVVNFFHYWRYHDVPSLTARIGLSAEYSQLNFEITYPKPEGIKGIRPHIGNQRNECKSRSQTDSLCDFELPKHARYENRDDQQGIYICCDHSNHTGSSYLCHLNFC